MTQTETRTMHTRGPWDSQPTAGHDKHGQSVVFGDDGKDIAVVYDGEANAKLIAAAPEMLYALETLERWLGIEAATGDPDAAENEALYKMQALAEAAIRKAKGE